MPSRLASNYPQLQRELDAVIPSEALQMATRIVLWAASEAGLNRRDIVRTLEQRDARLFDELCAEMEEQQYTLFECGDAKHLAFFNKARAYNASAWLVRGVPHEAIYESIFATEKSFVMSDFFRS